MNKTHIIELTQDQVDTIQRAMSIAWHETGPSADSQYKTVGLEFEQMTDGCGYFTSMVEMEKETDLEAIRQKAEERGWPDPYPEEAAKEKGWDGYDIHEPDPTADGACTCSLCMGESIDPQF